jgi:hypothetical protein
VTGGSGIVVVVVDVLVLEVVAPDVPGPEVRVRVPPVLGAADPPAGAHAPRTIAPKTISTVR